MYFKDWIVFKKWNICNGMGLLLDILVIIIFIYIIVYMYFKYRVWY